MGTSATLPKPGTKVARQGFWLLPSLRRPGNVARIARSYVDTEATGRVILRLHKGDPTLPEYEKLDLPETWDVHVGPECAAAGAMRWAFDRWPNEDFYGFLGDDIILQTPGWDLSLSNGAGRWGNAYPDDGIQGRNLATHPTVGGDLVRALGWWALPGVIHCFVDTALMYVAQRIGTLRYYPGVKFDHLHPIVGRGANDEVYQKGMSTFRKDMAKFNQWVNSSGTEKRLKRLERKVGTLV